MMSIDIFEELSAKVDTMDLKNRLKEIYYSGQDASIRHGVHLSDIKSAEMYKGKPNLCYRKIVLSAFFDAQPVKYKHPTIAWFERGIDLHKRWQEKFIRAGVVIHVETQHEVTWANTADNWRLLFTPDIIVYLGIGPEIVEIKGYKQAHYLKIVKEKELNPSEDSYIQAQWYMWLSGIHQALVIVENKNDQDFLVRRIQFDPDIVSPYEDRIVLIDALMEEYKTNRKLPKRICATRDDAKACECSQRDTCFADAITRARTRKGQ